MSAPYYFETLEISGYRKFDAETQKIKLAYPDRITPGSGLNIIVGSISSGKTSLLEIIGIMSGYGMPDHDKLIINDKLAGSMPQVHAEMVYASEEMNPKSRYTKRADFTMDGRRLEYSLIDDISEIANEEDRPEGMRVKFIRPNRSFKGEVVNLGPSIGDAINRGERSEDINLAGIVHYFETNSMLNIAHFKQYLDRYKYLGLEVEDVRISEPQRGGDGKRHFEAKLQDGEWHNVEDLSDGAKELIWWIHELHFGDVNNCEVVCIDELERSLHPQIQTIILEMIKDRSQHQQYFITTHSTFIANPHVAKKIHRLSRHGKINTVDREDFDKPSIFTTDHNRLFFADQVLFVEGIDDQEYFGTRLVEFNYPELPSRLFYANGKANIESFEKICLKLGIEFHAIVDDDFTDKVTQLNSGNRRMMERTINKLIEMNLLSADTINYDELDEAIAVPGKVKSSNAASDIPGMHYRKVTDRTIYPLKYGKLEHYKRGINREGINVKALQDLELKDIFKQVNS